MTSGTSLTPSGKAASVGHPRMAPFRRWSPPCACSGERRRLASGLKGFRPSSRKRIPKTPRSSLPSGSAKWTLVLSTTTIFSGSFRNEVRISLPATIILGQAAQVPLSWLLEQASCKLPRTERLLNGFSILFSPQLLNNTLPNKPLNILLWRG